MNRNQRTGATSPERSPDNKPAWPQDQHSGEGSASALATLRKLEDSRMPPAKPGEPDNSAEPGEAVPDDTSTNDTSSSTPQEPAA